MIKTAHAKAAILGAVAIALTFGVVTAMFATSVESNTVHNDGQLISASHGDIVIYDHPYGDLDEFRTAALTPYNDAIRDAFFMEHDFEADFHPDGEAITGQVVALMVHKQKHDGAYNPTEAERRYHEFIMIFEDGNINRPAIPDTAAEVDSALMEILGHAGHMHRAEALYGSFNRMANIGHVHSELFFSDEDFWGLQFVASACELDTPDVDCASFPEIIAANRDLTDEEIGRVEREIAKDETAAKSGGD